MKFRVHLETLDGRIVPSASPTDPPNDPPPSNPGSPAPGATDSPLSALLDAAAADGDYTAVQQYLQATYGASEVPAGDPGTTGTGDDANAQPTVTPPPTTTIPLPNKPPFSPIPPLADVPAPPAYKTDYSNDGGRAATAGELEELKNLDKHIAAVDIAKTRIVAEQFKLAKERVDLATAALRATQRVAGLELALAEAKTTYEGSRTGENEQKMIRAQGLLDGAKLILDDINTIQANAGQRIDYLDAKLAELETYRSKLVARRDAIISALVRGVATTPKPNYPAPEFIDWTSTTWTDKTKPLPGFVAKALGQ